MGCPTKLIYSHAFFFFSPQTPLFLWRDNFTRVVWGSCFSPAPISAELHLSNLRKWSWHGIFAYFFPVSHVWFCSPSLAFSRVLVWWGLKLHLHEFLLPETQADLLTAFEGCEARSSTPQQSVPYTDLSAKKIGMIPHTPCERLQWLQNGLIPVFLCN